MAKKLLPEDKKHSAKAFPIVGIGASAGGLEAVTELFRHIPPDLGMAYIYIHHVSATHKSNLPAILARETKMKVEEAKQLMRMEPNHVYIIPPNKEMLVIDGSLKLLPRKKVPHFMPVDSFFISLAEKHGEDAVGIILSGTDHDGTLGLKAIKEAGGFTMAQNETAQYDGMPRSAVAAEVVDMVLSPAEIGAQLTQLSKEASYFVKENVAVDVENHLSNILSLIKRATGIDFALYKKNTIRRRIVKQMILHKHQTFKDYLHFLRKNNDEVVRLKDELLINVTSFFRHIEANEYLRSTLFPAIINNKISNDPIRIWVPGCSTGEEAYTTAMLFCEVLGVNSHIPLQIFATDLSEKAITKARRGVYSQADIAGISTVRVKKFFDKMDGQYRVIKPIRDMCIFAPHNVIKDPPFSRLDFISCCNLLIYLDEVLQKKVIRTFYYALKSNAYLMLGKSETAGTSSALLFNQADKRYKIYSRTASATNRRLEDLISAGSTSDSPVRIKGNKIVPESNVLDKRVEQTLLSRYTPASVLINKDLEILQFRGSTGMYLEPAPGRASLNLLKMARKGMEFALRNTVGKAIKLGKAARTEGIEIKYKDTGYNITIEAVPLVDEEEGDERHYLVLFSENKAALPVGGGATLLKNKRIIQLEQELATLHSDMRSIIEEREVASEELQSANEEVTSSNEELQSINEELETSKEELESANEELMSYNQELQTTNQQLTATEEYSQAVISTVAESMLVLDKNLCIQSINPSFVQTFNINEESAQGQYVYKLDGGRWDMPELRDLLQKVLPATGSVRGFEISHDFPDLGAKNLMLNAQKLINKTGEELIFISIRDITSSVRARVISERNAWFEKLADDAPALIWVAGTNRKRTFFNKHWYEFTGRTFEQEVGDGWAETIHPDDLERCLDVYARSFEQRENFSMEYRRLRHDGEYRWLMVTGRPTFAPDGEFTGYVGICVDIHEQRKNAAQLMETTTQLLTLMEAMPQIVWTARPDGYLDFYNKRWYDYTGLSKGFDDSNWEKLIHPADLQRAIDTHYGSMKSGKPYQIELRFADREQPGAYRWFLCIGMPVRDDNGEIVKWIGTCTDIDDQKLKYHAIELHGLGYEMKFHSSMNVLSRLSFWF